MNVEQQPFLQKSNIEDLDVDTKVRPHLPSYGSKSLQYGIHAVLLTIWTLATVGLSISYRGSGCYASSCRYTVNGTNNIENFN